MPIDLKKTLAAVGNRMRAARNAKGYTQEKLAREMGKSRSNLANIECRAQQPTLSDVYLAAAALEVPVCSLLPDPIDDGNTAAPLRQVLEELDNLWDEDEEGGPDGSSTGPKG